MILTGMLGEKDQREQVAGLQTQVIRLSTKVLACEAREHPELPNYRHELFRRAIVVQSDEAWTYVYQLYQSHVLTWIWKSRGGKVLIDEGAGPMLVNAAFTKLLQTVTPSKFERFHSLGSLLRYLQLCCQGAVCDELGSRQTQARFAATSLEAITYEQEPVTSDAADEVLEDLATHGLWQIIAEELPSWEDRLLIFLTFVLGLKADEVRCSYPHLFATSRKVFLRKRAILTRLRRNHHMKEVIIARGIVD